MSHNSMPERVQALRRFVNLQNVNVVIILDNNNKSVGLSEIELRSSPEGG